MVGLSNINGIGWEKDGEGRGRVYKFLRGHRKVKYMEALVGEGKVGFIGFGEAIEK